MTLHQVPLSEMSIEELVERAAKIVREMASLLAEPNESPEGVSR
jgi:hypothetical protein